MDAREGVCVVGEEAIDGEGEGCCTGVDVLGLPSLANFLKGVMIAGKDFYRGLLIARG